MLNTSSKLLPLPQLPAAVAPPAVLRPLMALSAKMSLVQVAPLLMSVIVAGLIAQQGALLFSAYSLVASVNLPAFIAAAALLQGLYYVCGRAIGQGQTQAYQAGIGAGLVLAALIAAGCVLLAAFTPQLLEACGIEAALVEQARPLAYAHAIGVLPALLLIVYRVHASLQERAGQATLIYLAGSLAGVGLAAWASVVHRGEPAQAALMAALAVAASSWVMLAGAGASTWAIRPLRLDLRAALRTSLAQALRATFAVGWPIGAVVLLDNLAVMAASLLVGQRWPSLVPVHSAASLWVTFSMVVPLGLAQAAVQRVAVLHAQGAAEGRNRVARSALGTALVYGVAVTLLFAAQAQPIGLLLLGQAGQQAAVPVALQQVMPLAGAVLALQALIVVAAAVLRGIGQTRAPLVQAFFGYAVVGVGSQWLLGLVLEGGLAGIWWGLVAGFGVTALAVVWRCARELQLFSSQGETP